MNEFDLNLGANAHCTDGKCGQLARFAVDPETTRVKSLIVERGFLLKQARIFPLTLVQHTTADDIQLTIASEAVREYGEYRLQTLERVVDTPGGGLPQVDAHGTMATGQRPTTVRERVHEGISPKLAVLNSDTAVATGDHEIGKLSHLIVDAEDGTITRFVVHHGGLLSSKEVVVPASAVLALSEERIALEITEATLEELPTYEAADDNAEAMTNGGNGAPAGAPAGEPLAVTVERALAEDARTAAAVIDVIEDRGVVTLEGSVDSPAAQAAAAEVAAAQPGVISVMNNLRVE